jgi:hypothetical protein
MFLFLFRFICFCFSERPIRKFTARILRRGAASLWGITQPSMMGGSRPPKTDLIERCISSHGQNSIFHWLCGASIEAREVHVQVRQQSRGASGHAQWATVSVSIRWQSRQFWMPGLISSFISCDRRPRTTPSPFLYNEIGHAAVRANYLPAN